MISVDVFRGLTMAAMIIVNNPGDWGNSGPVRSSFFTGGAAALLLAACYWAIDVKGWRGWTKPFVILGVNAIALYVAAAILEHILDLTHFGSWIYQHGFQPFAPPRIASLGYAIGNLVVLFALLAWMYRRRWFLRA
jgi:predicted acyltransferase